MIFTASSASETPRIGIMGPKISSFISLASILGSSTRVGSTKRDSTSTFPPLTTSKRYHSVISLPTLPWGRNITILDFVNVRRKPACVPWINDPRVAVGGRRVFCVPLLNFLLHDVSKLFFNSFVNENIVWGNACLANVGELPTFVFFFFFFFFFFF